MKKIIFSLVFLVGCDSIAAQTAYTLDQLLDSAMQHNIAIRSAQHGIDAARQQRREAFTKYFPTVSATALTFNANRGMAKMEIDPQQLIPSSLTPTLAQVLPAEAMAALASPMSMTMMKNGTLASVMAVQPVFAGGQIVNGNRLARVGEEVSRLQLALSENEVERQVTRYFWQLVTLQEKMKTVDAVDSLLSDIYKDVDVAVRAGVALRNDLLQVQLRRNEVESQRLKLQNGINVVSLLLAQYCGLSGLEFSVECLELSDFSSDYESKVSQPSTLCSQLSALPEYQLLEKQVEATRLQKRMTVGEHLPTVAVGAGYNYHNMLDNDRTFGMVFATVSVPISDWWGGSHAIKRRQIAVQQAEEQLADNAELLTIRMQKAWNDVQEAQSRLAVARRSMEQAGENLRLHRDYYRAGTATMSDLLEAQLLAQQAQDGCTDAYADLQNSLLDYRQAVPQD